jgi:FkbM family methyltransferase
VAQSFSLRPVPNEAGRCPRCEEPLHVERLHFAVWRPVLEGVCGTCGHRYLQDLPAGHGLRYPSSIDLTSGDSWGEWFGPDLVDGWSRPDERPVAMKVDIHHEAATPVLLNCLDFIYGHALLRLFNAVRHLDDPGEDLVLLIPAALSPLVPEGAAEVWTVEEPLGRLRGWLPELDRRVAAELDRFEHCTLSPAFAHPHPSTFDLERFTGRLAPERAGEPSIVFVLREERFWGGSAEEQERRVTRTWEGLAARFPSAGATVVGVGPAQTWPAGLTDLRSERPDVARERKWLSVLAGADLAVGVHGSNMLLPSGLARATIEFLPRSRYGNYGQATLVTDSDPVATMLRHHTLHGNDDLADIAPDRVADLAAAVLASGPSLRASMLGSFAGQSEQLPPEPEFPLAERPAEPAQAAPLPRRALDVAAALAAEQRDRIAARRAEAAVARRVQEIGAPAVLEDRRGHRFRVLTSAEVEQFVVHGGGTEGEDIELARSYLAPGMTAVDVGAHIGKFAVVMGAAVGPTGAVHAFEPLPASFDRLLENLDLNGTTNVQAHRKAISDRPGEDELVLYGEDRDTWSSLIPRTIERPDWVVRPDGSVRVETTTIDDAAAELNIDHIDLLKIDVEGAEAKVLEGASGLFDRGAVDAMLIELSDETLVPAGTNAVEVVDRLYRWGLRTHVSTADGLEPFRPVGRLDRLVNVFAVNARGRERLRAAGLLSGRAG